MLELPPHRSASKRLATGFSISDRPFTTTRIKKARWVAAAESSMQGLSSSCQGRLFKIDPLELCCLDGKGGKRQKGVPASSMAFFDGEDRFHSFLAQMIASSYSGCQLGAHVRIFTDRRESQEIGNAPLVVLLYEKK